MSLLGRFLYLLGLGLIYVSILRWSRCTPSPRTGNLYLLLLFCSYIVIIIIIIVITIVIVIIIIIIIIVITVLPLIVNV